VVINGRLYDATEFFEAIKKYTYTSIKIAGENLVFGNIVIRPLQESVEDLASSITCHGSLAYCCPLTIPCMRRDLALKIMHISAEEYNRLKDELHEKFIKLSKSKKLSSKNNINMKEEESIEIDLNEKTIPNLGSFFENNDIIYERNFGKRVPITLNFDDAQSNYCPICGAKIDKDAIYCPMCGKKIKK